MTVIPYSEKYKEQIRNICLLTGPSEARTNPRVRDYILGNYCNYYIENEAQTCFVLIDEEDTARGYVLCAGDYRRYHSAFAPYAAGIRRNAKPFMIIEHLAEQLALRAFSRRYPAHLHIDITDEYTGRGSGTLLMNTLLGKLAADKVKGVMLIVGSGNKAAIRFYRRRGFEIKLSLFGGTIMAREI